MLQLSDRRLARSFRHLRRVVLARRRLLAAVLAGVAVTAGVHAATAPPPPSVGVLTAARDLPAGAVIGSDDLVTVDFAPDSVPSGSSTRDVVGRTLAAPVRRGEPVTDVRLLGPALTAADPDLTAVPVRLPDAGMAALLEVGDRIDLIATDPQGAGTSLVATGVPVLALPRASAETHSSGQPGGLVVVGVAPTEVTGVADAGVRAFLTYAFSH